MLRKRADIHFFKDKFDEGSACRVGEKEMGRATTLKIKEKKCFITNYELVGTRVV